MRPKRTAIVLGGIALLAAAIVLVVAKPRFPKGLFLEDLPDRPLEARVALEVADRHRKLATLMGGASNSRRPLPHSLLGKLEEHREWHALAVVLLVHGHAQEVIDRLEKSEPYPEVDHDRAAALLTLKRWDEALVSLERGLDEHPDHPQALWNRALVLGGLGLPLAAETAFQAIARLNEAGWAEEAAERARDAGKPEREAETRWKMFKAAYQAMISTGEVRPDLLNGNSPPILRLYFYEAVYASPAPERVRALLPLAQELDRVSGGTVLADYVQRVAARDFSKRRPLAEKFLRTVDRPTKTPDATQLIEDAKRSGETDLLLGAIVRAKLVRRYLDEFRQLVKAAEDPWFQIILLGEEAKERKAQGDATQARELLEQAIRLGGETKLAYRSIDAEIDLAGLFADLYLMDNAWEHAWRALQLARKTHEWDIESSCLELLSQAANFRKNFALARAYLEEALERSHGDIRHEQYINVNLARLERNRLRFAAARAAMDRAIATGLPLTLSGATILGDIVRFRLNPGDEEAIVKALGGDASGLSEGERLLRKHGLGRFYLTRDPPRGRALLEEVIRETSDGRAMTDTNARRARAYSFAYLLMEYGKAKDDPAALRLLAQEFEAELPKRCMVAIAQETERTLWISRSPEGYTRVQYDGDRSEQLGENLEGFLPADAVEELRPCEQVAVFAHPPLYGRAGLLPPDMAWSYHAGVSRRSPPALPSRARLVIADVEIDERKDLPKLARWITDEEPGVTYVQGSAATPSHVLKEMTTAGEITLVTHGELRAASGSVALQLAQQEDGKGELTIDSVRQARLQGTPLVTLIACSAARTAPALHEPYSMPAAFIEAGARAVIAATVKIPDRSAYQFFNAVQGQIRQGKPPAEALRIERKKWLDDADLRKENGWISNVLLFD